MATGAEWSRGYARQARADFDTFGQMQSLRVPDCHKLQFLQMACEKLVKACLCAEGTDPADLQSSHTRVAGKLPLVLKQQALLMGYSHKAVRDIFRHAKHLAREVECLAPAVKRGGLRPDNCEYPWEDARAALHVPLDWDFHALQLLVRPHGRGFLKLVTSAIDRLLAP